MKRTSRIFSFVLMLCLMLVLLSTTVFAADDFTVYVGQEMAKIDTEFTDDGIVIESSNLPEGLTSAKYTEEGYRITGTAQPGTVSDEYSIHYIAESGNGRNRTINITVAKGPQTIPTEGLTVTTKRQSDGSFTVTPQRPTNGNGATIAAGSTHAPVYAFTSSNSSVATIDPASGVVTLLALGTTDITVSSAETDSYEPAVPVTFTLTVQSDDVPNLAAGSVNRTSDVTATVTFNSDKAGSYSYLVLDAGAAAPSAEEVTWSDNAGELAVGVNTITDPRNLTGGAKKIYIVANGNDGVLSDVLTMDIPAPSLDVSPDSLDFGKVLVPTAATAQTVTVTANGLYGDVRYALSGTGAAAFAVAEEDWSAATGGTLSVSFTPTAAQDYTATLAIGGPGAPTKTVALSGTGIAGDHTVHNPPDANTPLDTTRDMVITINGDYVNVVAIRLNDNLLTRTLTSPTTGILSAYPGFDDTLGRDEAGSVVVTLYKEFLQWLPNGTYTLEVEFLDGTVTGTGSLDFLIRHDDPASSTSPASSTPPASTTTTTTAATGGSPQTGDGSHMGLWITLLIASLSALCAGMWVLLRRHRRAKE